MGTISLKSIFKTNNTIKFIYDISEDLKKYFTDKNFLIEYQDDMENVPDSILAIPFVCNVLPIIWLTNSILGIDELDNSFYNSISEFKKGYEKLYPEADFLGEIRVKKLVDNRYTDTGKCALFYSGGLDSAQTLVSHLSENPDLLSIWGSDVRFDNEVGWKNAYNVINEAAEQFCLKESVFRSTFREFDKEWVLEKDFYSVLGDGWWHGVKHGIGLIGHAAPYAYIHRLSKIYIASSNSPDDGLAKCASSPYIDNFVKFASCEVIHDAFEFNRQNKAHNIVEFCKNNNIKLNIHACWESDTGVNCCHCEKCYRTISNFWVEGADPKDYGFGDYERYINNFQFYVLNNTSDYLFRIAWSYIHSTAKKNKSLLKQKPHYKDFKWLIKADFEHPEKLKMPFSFRIRQKLAHLAVYQWLHRIKTKIRG